LSRKKPRRMSLGRRRVSFLLPNNGIG
jgi:hypothetical protein